MRMMEAMAPEPEGTIGDDGMMSRT
jgi:hypothetical protein